MPVPSPARARAFVRRHTRLEPVADIPGLRLHVAADVAALMGHVAAETGDADPALPFWAFPWAGGLGLARYLLEHPDEVTGRRVLDLAAGSGLVGLVAARLGATVTAVDTDPFAEAAARLNALANDLRLAIRREDLLDGRPPAVDVILAGDVCYEETMAGRAIVWLRQAASAGTRVLLGDPGRTYLPADLERLAVIEVGTSRELERAERTPVAVYAVRR